MTETSLELTSRRTTLDNFVPVAAVSALESAHSAFFGALNAGDLTEAGRAVLAAVGLTQLRATLGNKDVLPIIKQLAGSRLGFRMDRSSYPDAVLIDVAAQAILRGLPLYGNCFNVIAEGFYSTKEGFEYLMAQHGVKYSVQCVVAPIDAKLRAAGGHVGVKAAGQYRAPGAEKNGHYEATYNVRLNKNNKVAEENVEGKAKRKWLRDVWAMVSGLQLPDAELEAAPERANGARLSREDFERTEPAPMDDKVRADLLKALKPHFSEDEIGEMFGPPPEWTPDDAQSIADAITDAQKASA